MLNRRNAFFAEVQKAGFDFALVHKPENIRYLTGFTGEGCLLVDKTNATILTSFLYMEQAEREARNCRVTRVGGDVKLMEALSLLLGDGAARLAVETDFITADQYMSFKRALDKIELDSLGSIPEKLRAVKDEGEIECIKKACDIACLAFAKILEFIKPGMTEREIQIELDYQLLRLGSHGKAFDTIVCAGPNGSLPHATPGDRPVQVGDLVTMDFGATVNGYRSDMTRTIAIGQISPELRAIYDTVLKAQLAALHAIQPSMRCSDADKIARDIIESVYPGAFGHTLGHGVGLKVHEQPSLSSRDQQTLVPGHVVTIEPGIYIPGLGGCRIEDMGVVTEDGFNNLITAEKQLITL